MTFAEKEPREGVRGGCGQDLPIGNLFSKGFCTGEAFSWLSKPDAKPLRL